MSDSRIELSPEVLQALTNVSELLVDEHGAVATLKHVIDVTCRALPGSDGAGISLLRDGLFTTPTSSGEWANALDEAQYENTEGPCLEAGITSEVKAIDAMSSEDRWPRFKPEALRLGLGSSLSFPLGDAMGALNVYSREENSFTAADRALGQLLAAQAAVAVRNGELFDAARDLADGLKIALESRDLIGQAKGILMEREGIDEDAAFEMLRTMSQHTNLKLRDVALQLLQERKSSV